MINDIDINEKVVSNKHPLGKQDSKFFVSYEDDKKKWDLYAYSF